MVLEHCLYFLPTIFKLEIKLKKNIIPNRDNRKKITIKIPVKNKSKENLNTILFNRVLRYIKIL